MESSRRGGSAHPALSRLKELAYAGAVINYASAVASHVIVGDGISAIVAPAALLALAAVSWVLRRSRAVLGRV